VHEPERLPRARNLLRRGAPHVAAVDLCEQSFEHVEPAEPCVQFEQVPYDAVANRLAERLR
jgi:hypothetical protein